jgi:biotin carboxylase
MSYRDPAGPMVIVDPYSSGALLAPAFHEYGVGTVAVCSGPEPPEVYASSFQPGDFSQIIVYTGNLESVVGQLRDIRPRAVVTGCESGVELADVLAPLVVPELCNVPGLAAARRHKGEMAAAAAAAGLPIIPQISTADPEEVASWLTRTGLHSADLVIKPPKSASTDGVTRIRADQDWRAVFAAGLGHRNRLGLINDVLVVQQYLTGTEYVVDTFSHAGRHTVTDVCRYRKVDNGPHMAVYDAMEWVSPDDPALPEIIGYARDVLDAVGMRYGAAHVELMATENGPRMIEVGARAHGGGQPKFCAVATGDSQVLRTARYFAGLGTPPDGYELIKHMLVVFHIASAAGTVTGTSALDAVRDLPSHHFSVRHFKDGDRIELTKDLFGTLDLGFVVLAHSDRDQVLADYAKIRELESQLIVAPVPPPPDRPSRRAQEAVPAAARIPARTEGVQ